MENQVTNRAKMYQIALFPMNNGATNVYFVLILTYVATFGDKVLALGMFFASAMLAIMRVFDAITDPIIGAIMDRTNGKWGKFRPFMLIGNIIMAIATLLLYVATPYIPETMLWLRYVAFILFYAIWVIGYTFQTSVTRSGQTVITNDPKQRPLTAIFNAVGQIAGMGVMQVMAFVAIAFVADADKASFYSFLTPIGIVVSFILTVLAIVGIWEKDNPKYYGLGESTQEKTKISEYIEIIKNNKPMQRLMVAGAGCKLALAVATSFNVLCMIYGSMMGNYNGLYFPMMAVGYVFSAPFFLLSARTSQKNGQKASLVKYVTVALISYVGVVAMLLLWQQGNPSRNLMLFGDGGLSINLYTILFIIFFGIGYGAYYSTADLPIPMVADCSDYETYRSGKYIPGIMGTMFSLVDKLVSSLSALIVSIAVSFIGLSDLPTAETPYVEGMNWVVIVLFCIIPMIAWIVSLIAMRGYSLTGERMKEIQAINAKRKEAIESGMSLEQAMETYK